MSAAHRSLARLPLDVFSDLVLDDDGGLYCYIEGRGFAAAADGSHENNEDDYDRGRPPEPVDPAELRTLVCSKLRDYCGGSGGGCTTVGQLLRLSPAALLQALDPVLTHEECQEMVRRVCTACAAPPTTALSLLRETAELSSSAGEGNSPTAAATVMRHVPSGMPALDDCLKGGFRVGTITELVGRAGVGKTQLALQLCVVAAKHGQGSVYIDAERKISLNRLREIAEERAAGDAASAEDLGDGSFPYSHCQGGRENGGLLDFHGPLHASAGASGTSEMSYRSAREVLENVTVHSPGSTREIAEVVSSLEEEIVSRNEEATIDDHSNSRSSSPKYPVRLIVLDSIAAPARRDFGIESAPQRVSALFRIAQTLKRIADQLKLAVVVVNQVGLLGSDLPTGHHNKGGGGDATLVGSDFVAVAAALGTSWHHCVSTRILLEHERDPHRVGTSADVAHERFNSDGGVGTVGDGWHPADRQAWMSERGRVRTATVVKSNVANRSSMTFTVTAMGLCEITCD